jgi:signal transduction histidine kinase
VYNINRLKATETERKEFIATISHDLRTPLAIARGYAETSLLKKEKEDTGEPKKFIELVLQKINQVEYLVTQLFDLSKMEAVDFRPKKEPFIFSDILQENMAAYSSAISEKNIRLVCAACDISSWVLADVGMMERVVQNMLVNAIKYTPQDGNIFIQLISHEKELVLTIQNSGAPIDPEVIKWINAAPEGSAVFAKPPQTGFGLLIIKKIAQLHQFSFHVAVSEAYGNTVVLGMPVYQFKQKVAGQA